MSDWLDPFGALEGGRMPGFSTQSKTVDGEWNGRGAPPDRAAAIEWAVANGVPRDVAEKRIRDSGKSIMGVDARRIVDEKRIREEKEAAAEARDEKRAEEAADAPLEDVNSDGQIDAADAALQVGAGGDDGYGAPPTAGGDGRGAPLWPFGLEGLSEEEAAGLTVRDRSTTGQHMEDSRFGNLRIDRQTSARYYAADTLQPLRWSQERRADLQRVLQSIGLYGDQTIRLGMWTELDQSVFKELLGNANAEGLTWHELLVKWKREPPEDILAKINGEQPAKPTIEVSSPADIAAVGRATTRAMIGRDDPTFAQGLVPSYQAAEAAAQQAVVADQDAGGGGTVVDAPNLQNFAEQRLEETNPVEVDSYATLSNFNEMLRMLGAAG